MKGLLRAVQVQATRAKRTVAIGVRKDSEALRASLTEGSQFANLIVVGAQIEGYECIAMDANDKTASDALIDCCVSKHADAIVRPRWPPQNRPFMATPKPAINYDVRN